MSALATAPPNTPISSGQSLPKASPSEIFNTKCPGFLEGDCSQAGSVSEQGDGAGAAVKVSLPQPPPLHCDAQGWGRERRLGVQQLFPIIASQEMTCVPNASPHRCPSLPPSHAGAQVRHWLSRSGAPAGKHCT